jgi:hypothetical protein
VHVEHFAARYHQSIGCLTLHTILLRDLVINQSSLFICNDPYAPGLRAGERYV